MYGLFQKPQKKEPFFSVKNSTDAQKSRTFILSDHLPGHVIPHPPSPPSAPHGTGSDSKPCRVPFAASRPCNCNITTMQLQHHHAAINTACRIVRQPRSCGFPAPFVRICNPHASNIGIYNPAKTSQAKDKPIPFVRISTPFVRICNPHASNIGICNPAKTSQTKAVR